MEPAADSRKTKIVCTLGPASSSPEMIRRMIQAGMNVARLNFSHGSYESHKKTLLAIRAAADELSCQVGILQDLAGPKIRLGEIEGPELHLKSGDPLKLVTGKKAEGGAVPVNYPYLYEDVREGDRILLADGKVELYVTGKSDGLVSCRVVVGGTLSSHKGVNLPTSDLRIAAFTDKDRADLEFGLKEGVDFVAMSFVRHEKDLDPLKEMMKGYRRPPLLIAKIEKPQAVDRLDQILKAVDGVMVARGDLGVEMPVEEVPIIQKLIIRKARQAARVVITATQMLGSMVSSPRPSRAEVTDVANAVLDGTDAVMLSDETAVGDYPVAAVRVLDMVSRYTEPQMNEQRFLDEGLSPLLPATEAAITRAAASLAEDLKPAALVATTASGSTARYMARYRLPLPVIGLTSEPRTCRQLCLSWGVIPAQIPVCENVDAMITLVRKWAAENNVARPEDRLILTAGIPLQVHGTTNLIKVIDMTGPEEKGNY